MKLYPRGAETASGGEVCLPEPVVTDFAVLGTVFSAAQAASTLIQATSEGAAAIAEPVSRLFSEC